MKIYRNFFRTRKKKKKKIKNNVGYKTKIYCVYYIRKTKLKFYMIKNFLRLSNSKFV